MPRTTLYGTSLPPRRPKYKVEGAAVCLGPAYNGGFCTLNTLSDGSEDALSEGVSIVRRSAGGGRVAETPESLRKSGERGSGRRRREERRVSEGRYASFGRSDEGGVKGLS